MFAEDFILNVINNILTEDKYIVLDCIRNFYVKNVLKQKMKKDKESWIFWKSNEYKEKKIVWKMSVWKISENKEKISVWWKKNREIQSHTNLVTKIQNNIYKLLMQEKLTDEENTQLEYFENKREELFEKERVLLSSKINETYNESLRLDYLEKLNSDKDKYLGLEKKRKVEFRTPYQVTKRRLDILDYKFPGIKHFIYPLHPELYR